MGFGIQPVLFKILFLLIAYISHGRPFVGLVDYGYALIVAYLLLFGVVRARLKPLLAITGVGILTMGLFVPQLSIPEQQRILMDSQGNPITPEQFLQDPSRYPFFLTADGYVQGYKDKRLVRKIDIDQGIISLRSGWMNRPEYNVVPEVSSHVRKELPFVVCYTITPQVVGMTLRLEGQAVLEQKGSPKLPEHFTKSLTIQDQDIGSTWCGFGGKWDETGPHNLQMTLEKTARYKVYEVVRVLCLFSGLVFLFFGIFSISPTIELGLQSFLLSLSAFSFCFYYPYVARWGILAKGGMDGIMHDGYPYWMLEKWASGNWWEALMSPEQVFYFMPGMRYVRLFELLLFGDAYILQVSLLLFVPIIFYRFFRVFLTRTVSFTLSLLTFLHLFNGIGLSLKLYLKTMLELYGEGFAYALLFISVTMLVKSIQKVGWGLFAFFLVLICLTIRPNLGIFVGILCAIHLFTTTFCDLPWTSRLIMLFGLAPGFLIPIHNILGGEFVLLTKASQIPENLHLSPDHYFQALCNFFGMPKACDYESRVLAHFQQVYPQYIVAWLGCLWLSFKGQTPVVKSLALATVGGLSVHFFYLPNIRYLHPYLTIAIVLGLFQVPRFRALSSNISSS